MAMAWIVVDEQEAAVSWDLWATQMPFSSPFQSFAMAQYSKKIGSKPYFCVCFDEAGTVRAMALCTIKAQMWKAAIFACIGGPLGNPALWSGIPAALRQAAGLALVYVRFRSDQAESEADIAALTQNGWRRVPVASGSNRTMTLDLSKTMDALKGGLATKWRRDLAAAMANELTLTVNANHNAADLDRIFSAMVATKQFASTIDEDKIRALVEERGNNIVLVTASDADGNIVAFRCALALGHQAVDFIAAASPLGRDLRATFAVLWREIEALRALGVTEFDLGGIDPDGNPGVYRFKARTGAVERTMLGEFEIANWAPLCDIVNLAVYARELKFKLRKRISALMARKSKPATPQPASA